MNEYRGWFLLIGLLVTCCALFVLLSGSESSGNEVTILWWTDSLYPHYGVDETLISCGRGSCRSSKRRARKVEPTTRGFLFYGSDFREDDLPLPRHAHHLWALLHEESPLNNFLFSHAPGISLFNYTATFRRTSDYPLSTQFIRDLAYLTDRAPVALAEKNRLRREEHLAPLVYVQSHCNVPSDRDRYVAELSKHIAVDSYGSCLHNRDLPTELNGTERFEDELFMSFLARYKFHLAFENALCPDYMTEKLFRALHVGSVPVYRGSPLAHDWEPARPSFILADEFDSPLALSDFIEKLDGDDAAYERYLAFKGGITNDLLVQQMNDRDWGSQDFVRGFECFFCDALLEGASSLKLANASHMGCPEPHPSLGDERQLQPDDEWLQQSWVESYWYAYDLARALQAMVANGEKDSASVHDYALAMKYKQ